MARCGQEEMVKQRPWSVTDAKGATGSGTWGASSGELGEGGGKGRGRGARDGGRRSLAAMARRLLRRLASMATGEASSSKRSLARCRRGRGRRQRRKGATTMMGPCAGWLSWWSPTAAGGDGIGREALLLSLRDGATREEGIERWLSLAMRCTSVAAGRGGMRGDEMRGGWARVRAGARLGLGGWLGRPRWRKKWPEAWLGWLSLTNE